MMRQNTNSVNIFFNNANESYDDNWSGILMMPEIWVGGN